MILPVLLAFLNFKLILGCNLPIELMDGCAFEPVILVNPRTGFVVAGESCGVEMHKVNFVDQPYVYFADAVNEMRYTLIMIDNDDPMVDEGNQFLQWLVTDIDGRMLKNGLPINAGNTIVGYIPPVPVEDLCVHRYSIYIYEHQFHPLELPELPEFREDFDLMRFVQNVVPNRGICGPVASIEFKTRF